MCRRDRGRAGLVDSRLEMERLGRYALFDLLASGGMASVYLGRLAGAAGFSKTVAVKGLHPHLARDPDFKSMFLDEAHLAARIRHPNVASTLDVVSRGDELFIIMEFVHGESLSYLQKASSERGLEVPLPVVSAVINGVLAGLHAAHEATSETGLALGIVHRDVSPQNVIVGADGITRVIDFGVAKAVSRVHSTRGGEIKGKLSYMAPEQINRGEVDRRADVYAVGVVLWEVLTGRRLFVSDDALGVIQHVLTGEVAAPSTLRTLPPTLDALVARAMAKSPGERFASALAMADALEAAIPPASPLAVANWVKTLAGERLNAQAARIAELEGIPLKDDGAADAEVIGGAALRTSEILRLSDAATAVTPAAALGASAARAELVSAPSGSNPSPTPRRWVIAALVATSGAGAFAATRMLARPETVPAEAATLEAQPPSAVALTVASSSVDAASPVRLDAAVLGDAAVVMAATSAARAPSGIAPRPKRVKPGCSVPFSIDPQTGVRRYKPECL